MIPADRRIERYTFRERLVHALTGLSYVYLVLTGLAFWTPALYWIAIMLGGGFLSRQVHPWVGLFFTVFVVRMFVMWHGDMRTTDADRLWRKQLIHYVRNQDDRVPVAGRFNYGQKQMFWVMAWSALVLLLSGIVLWFPHAIPPPREALRQTAALLHATAALVTIGAFIIHLYMGIAVVPGGLRAILHGDVSEDWAKHHHRLWTDSRRDRRR